jgi:riboflavin synthase
MFTGIIEGLGTITGIQPSGMGKHFTIDADFDLDRLKIGDSVAVNGACLTAVKAGERRFEVDVAPETLSLTTFSQARIGDRVNLERALRLSDRLDGHLVSGHIDGLGAIKSRSEKSNAIIISISVPVHLTRYMILKGSVAVDGVSLTINECQSDFFEVSIIPYTAALTTVGFKKIGAGVNIETDLIGKYIERFVSKGTEETTHENAARGPGIDMALLAKSGFIK